MKLMKTFLLLSLVPAGAFFLFGCGGNGNTVSTPSDNGEPAPTSSVVRKFAKLDSTQVAPTATNSTLTAFGSLTVDVSTGAVSGSLMFLSGGTVLTAQGPISTATITAIQVHEGLSGTNGDVVMTLTVNRAGGVLSVVPAGTVLTPAQVSSFIAGNLYFNVHTVAHPEGEIRGQINVSSPAGGIGFSIVMDGSEEVPPVVTGAFGDCSIIVNTVTGAVTGDLQMQPVPSSAITTVNVHGGGWGSNGAVVITLAGSGNFWRVPPGTILTPSQITSFIEGNYYVNVHTVAHPEGEIRGQLDNLRGAPQLASFRRL